MKELLLIASIHLMAVMSPGPDFALVLKNSLSGGRKIGMYAALGIALGIGVHVSYSILGLALIISKSILLFNIIKLVGAGYLIYIGFKALRSKKNSEVDSIENIEEISKYESLKQGLLTNILNPKVTLFFLSLFTQVISPTTGNNIKMLYGIEMILATFLWFSAVSIIMTQKPVKIVYNKVKHHIDHAFGAILIALGLKVAFGSK